MSSKFNDYITPSGKTFNSSQVSCQEIYALILKIPDNKAIGFDNISACLVKEAAPIVTQSCRGTQRPIYVRSVLNGFLYALEACFVNLELP